MSNCIVLYDQDEGPDHPPNCPNCGKWLRWEGWDKGFSCKCNAIINIPGSGLYFGEIDDSEYALRVCKKPEV